MAVNFARTDVRLSCVFKPLLQILLLREEILLAPVKVRGVSVGLMFLPFPSFDCYHQKVVSFRRLLLLQPANQNLEWE